jgi:acyl-CoA dehydrogenase
MDFQETDTQRSVREAMERLCARFGDAYWLDADRAHRFPHEFHAAMAEEGWLGICMPEEVGGAGLGVADAAVMMQAIAQSGAGMTGASAVHMNIFGPMPVVVFGTAAQKARMLPPLISGAEKACFAVTEPTRARHHPAPHRRRTPRGPLRRARAEGLDQHRAGRRPRAAAGAHHAGRSGGEAQPGPQPVLHRARPPHVEVREIPKMGRHAVDSNQLFLDGLEVPEEDRIGEEGRGFDYILHGLNPERVLVAAEAVGIGHAAIARGAAYAKDRVVFGRPIGMNQGVQHPLAACWMRLEAARLATMQAAWRYDAGLPCGAEANAAKWLAGEAGFEAAQTAVMTLGGYGYAQEFHLERLLRESFIPRIAPVSPQLILCHIAERVLGLPRSY